MRAADLAGRDEALVRVRRRHPDVDDRDVGARELHAAEQLVGRRRPCRRPRWPASDEQALEPLAKQRLVVGDHDPHGSSAWILSRSARRSRPRVGRRGRRGGPRGRRRRARRRPAASTSTASAPRRARPARRARPSRPAPPLRRRCTRPTPRPRRSARSGQGADPQRHACLLGERLDGGGQSLVREHRRKDPVRELAKLLDREAQLLVRLARAVGPSGSRDCASRRSDSERPTRRCWAPSCRSRSRRWRSGSPASTIRAREARSSSSRARTSACRRSFSSASRAAAVTSSTSCSSSSTPRLVGDDGDRRPSRIRLVFAAAAGSSTVRPCGVDEPARVPERVREDELRIADDPREHVAQAAGRRRLRRARRRAARCRRERGAPAPSPTRRRRGHPTSAAAWPSHSRRSTSSRSRGGRGRARPRTSPPRAPGRRRRRRHRSRRGRRSPEPNGHENRQCERPGNADVHPGAREVGRSSTPVGDQRRGWTDTGRNCAPRVEEQRRQHPEHQDRPDVGEAPRLRARRASRAGRRVDEHRVADERRAGSRKRSPSVNASDEPTAGVVQLRHEPGDAGGRQQRPEAALRPAPPEGEAAARRAPSRQEQGDGAEGRLPANQ